MNPGQHDAVGIGRGPGLTMDADFAPPKHSADYEAKPLPAIPPRTSFSIPDMKAVFKTSKRNLNTRQYVYDWDRQGDNISLTTDGRSGTPRSRSLPENDASSIPTTPSNEILSPQPRHSRQKILRLTGNISPSMSLASLTPSLHNSQQKIKQLTGLDVGSRSSSEGQPDALQYPFDEVSPVSPTSSTYSREGLEATISEPDSDASDYTLHSDPNGVTTQLTAPSFGAPSSRPSSTAAGSPTTRLRLNSFAFREPDASGQRGSLADFKAHYRQGSTTGSWGSSRKSSVTVVPQYANANGGDTTKGSPRASASATSIVDTGPPSPSFKQRSLVWDTSPMEHLRSGGQEETSPTSSPPPSSSSTSANRKPGSFSDRRASSRGRVPTPLEPSGDPPPKAGMYSLPQRTPYPPPPPPPSASARSAFDTDSDDGKRTSFLAKVFGGGGGSPAASASSKRQSRGPTPSSSPCPYGEQSFLPSSGGGPKATSIPSHPPPPPVPESPRWSHAPDAQRSPTDGDAAAGGGGGSAGVGARARPLSSGGGLFHRARQSVGLRSKSDKRRDTLKGKIRVVET